jgi:DNA-directed RNA polymerase subunit RPC12/RpoP
MPVPDLCEGDELCQHACERSFVSGGKQCRVYCHECLSVARASAICQRCQHAVHENDPTWTCVECGSRILCAAKGAPEVTP